MAKTYVGYVKREVASEIDWASIGSDISQMLLDERKAREDKKKEIDDASREFAKVLTEAEGSEHTGINQFFLDGSNSISEIRLMQDRLLKSGQLRLRDYNIQRQNIVDGTNEMLSLVKDYDTKYKEKMARLQNEESAAQEIYQMEQIEGFSNFQNHRLYVNPTNGQISVGKTVPGKGGINELSKNPNDFSTMQALRNRLNIKIDRYDWDKNLQQGVDRLAKVVIAKNSGAIKTAEDARQLEEQYTTAKNNWIDSMMTSSVNVGSMLTDWIGGYTFTQDAFEAGQDDSKILLVPDPRQPSSGNLVPKLSDAQEKVVKDRLEQEFESRVDRIETAMPTLGGGLTGGERIAQQQGEIGYSLALDITKGGQVGATALTKIKANNPSIENVYETDDTYVIQYNDGTRDNVIQKIKDGEKELQEESAVALMAAVNPKFDVTAAQTAKERYFKGQTPTGLTKSERVGQRTKLPAQTGATYQTTTSILNEDNKSVAQEINEITPNGDKAPQVDAIIKSIQPLPGTENIINNIGVTGISSAFKKDILKISIPDEIKDVFEKYTFYKDGEVEIKYDDAEDKTELNKVVDLILKGMFDVYNAQGQAQGQTASASTGTTAAAKGELDPED
jgi:hypothetical protein